MKPVLAWMPPAKLIWKCTHNTMQASEVITLKPRHGGRNPLNNINVLKTRSVLKNERHREEHTTQNKPVKK